MNDQLAEEAKRLMSKLREPVDQGGFDGWVPDGLHVAAADCIYDLAMRADTERTMHAAWRKRADEAEARESKLLAEIDRLRGESQRRDMSSAPKDGTEVVLWVKLRAGIPHCCLVGHYMPGGHCIEDHPAIDEGWYFWNGCMFDRAAEPIAWMPLPAAPDATVPPRPQEAPLTDIVGQMSIAAFQAEHANDPPVPEDQKVRFSEADVAELMYRMRAELKQVDESIPEMVVRILNDHTARQQGEERKP